MPQLLYHDFNGDGTKELAVILHIGSGTGVSIRQLHMLRENEYGYFDLANSVYASNVRNWALDLIEITECEKSDGFQFTFAGTSFMIDIYREGAIIGPDVGNIIDFEFCGAGITVKAAVGAIFDGSPSPVFFGEISAEIEFDGQYFTFTDYKFNL